MPIWLRRLRCEFPWPAPFTGGRSNVQRSLDGIVERFAHRGADEHFDAGDKISVFVVPVVSFLRHHLNDRNARIVLSFGEPRFEQRLPEMTDLFPVAGNGSRALQLQKIGV